MDDDLEFALESIKDLLEQIQENGGAIADQLGDVTGTLSRIADDIVLLKIDVDSVTGSGKKPESSVAGFCFGILILLLIHVVHHW